MTSELEEPVKATLDFSCIQIHKLKDEYFQAGNLHREKFQRTRTFVCGPLSASAEEEALRILLWFC
jgi:hypothetical protein